MGYRRSSRAVELMMACVQLVEVNKKSWSEAVDIQNLEQEALSLPAEDRAKLAQKLLLSLDTLSAEELEQAWLIEAGRRAHELDRGEVQPVSADEVRRKARELLR